MDDDPQLLEVYRHYLEDRYELDSATSGEAALEALSPETDVVLLDRRMPGMSGSEVAAAIRERGYDCRVAMVTALAPEVDIVDMGIDDYLVKPATRSKLRNVVDSLLRWGDYDSVLREYFELSRKAAVLEEESAREELESSEEYRRLKARLETLRSEADELVEEAETDVVEEFLGRAADDRPGDAEPAGSTSR